MRDEPNEVKPQGPRTLRPVMGQPGATPQAASREAGASLRGFGNRPLPRRMLPPISLPTAEPVGRVPFFHRGFAMRSKLLPLAAVFAFSPALRADDASEARAIVEKSVKALGYKAGEKPAAITWKDKGKFHAGGMSLPFTGDFAFQAPDKYRFSVTAELEGMKITFVAVANGPKGWESALGMTQDLTGEKLEYVVNQVYNLNVTSLLPLLTDKEYKLATAGEKDVNGKKAAVVTVTREKKPTVTLYFDKESGLLVRADMKVKDEFQEWKEVTDEVYFDDYKDVGGKKHFCKMKIVRDGKTFIESTLSDQKTADKLDPKLFEKP